MAGPAHTSRAEVVIGGAGFAGLALAIALRQGLGDPFAVTVIDPERRAVVATLAVGRLPQHVVPSHDLARLWVANNDGNSLTPIDPATGVAGAAVPVEDPYNVYFTPDGASALVMAERRERLDFRDPDTMALTGSIRAPCRG